MKVEQKYPRVFEFLYSGKVRFFLLIIITILFALDWRDAMTVSPPIINMPFPAPIVQYPARIPAPMKSEILLQRQSPLAPEVADQKWQKNMNLDKPGVSAILTASGQLKHPLFTFTCTVACMYTDGSGISTSYLAHLIKERSTDQRLVIQLDVPGKLIDGQQIEMHFRSQSNMEVKIEHLELMQQ